MRSAWWRAGHVLCAIERGQNLGARCYFLFWCVPSLIVFMAYINPQGFAECQMQCRVQWYKRKWDIWVRLSDSTSQGGKQTQKHWTQMLTFVVLLQRRLSFDSTHWQLCFNTDFLDQWLLWQSMKSTGCGIRQIWVWILTLEYFTTVWPWAIDFICLSHISFLAKWE